MILSIAEDGDVPELARLLWLDANNDERADESLAHFAASLSNWWRTDGRNHNAFVARLQPRELVGMAWVAPVPRVPRPGNVARRSADIQSVFVMPEPRGRGLGAALVQAAADFAVSQGALHVTVHSSRRAVPLYERLGFESSPELLGRDVTDAAGGWPA